MSTTTAKVLEGVRLTDSLKECLIEAQRRANDVMSELPLGPSSTKRSSLLSPMTLQQARSQLTEYHQENDTLPIAIIRAMFLLLGDERVEQALSTTSQQLAFTPMIPLDRDAPQQQKWKQRMQRLALLQEERSYSKLTNNLGKVVQDDVSIRSMTYAASIGLNMIVAPISFGVFMYFFAGGIIDYVWAQPNDNARLAASTVDNRKVICGVISGVVMLIVEMLLFVIRTHEMDKAMRKKKKKKAVKPFGPYSSASAKTFKGE